MQNVCMLIYFFVCMLQYYILKYQQSGYAVIIKEQFFVCRAYSNSEVCTVIPILKYVQ